MKQPPYAKRDPKLRKTCCQKSVLRAKKQTKNLPQDCVRLAKTLQTVPTDLKLPTHPRKL